LVDFAYFAGSEAAFGCSAGKLALRLRVGTAAGAVPPPVGRAVLRSAVFVGLTDAWWAGLEAADENNEAALLLWTVLGLVSTVALLATMRGRNGYRGLHEWASGTRTVRLPWPKRRRTLTNRAGPRPAGPKPDGLPDALGPFRPTGTLRGDPVRPVLVGEDPTLRR